MAVWPEYRGLTDLTSAQGSALAVVRQTAEKLRLTALEQLTALGLSDERLENALSAIQSRPVALHFHPDRIGKHGLTVADDFLNSGRYKSQFETGISSGSVSAHPGGERHKWETAIFGGAYDEAQADERPKYGAIDLFGHHNGPAPRFGSCAFRLKPEVNSRTTFCAADSHELPETWGLLGAMEGILLEAVSGAGGHLTGGKFISFICNSTENCFETTRNRELDLYIEAQVHGPVSLEEDVVSLSCDQSFRNTAIGEKLELSADRYGFPILWQPAIRLKPDSIPADFRGAEVPVFAARIACDGWIVAADLGLAMNSNSSILDGLHESLPNLVKKLWHALAVFGEEAPA